jgi:type VI secretion system FHA domain protein
MYLTLEVVSPQAASLGADRRRVVSQRGLTIGRIPGNDWVIPDPYISKQHARISYANGSFFVEGLGRNAIAIGSPGSTLPPNQPQPLRSGDRLFIDQYEMIVTALQGDPPVSSPPGAAPPGLSVASDDPFAVLPATPASPRNPQSASIPDIWDGSPAQDFVDTGVLDPLDVLGRSGKSEPEPLPPVNWQRESVLERHFEPPPVRPPVGGSPFDLLEPGGRSPAEPPAAPPPPGPGGIPDNWDRTNLTFRDGAASKAQPPRPVPPALPAPPVQRARVGSVREGPGPTFPKPEPIRREVRASVPDPRPSILEPGPAMPERRSATPEPRASGAIGAELSQLLQGAGLSGQDLSPEMMQDLGKVLRVVVEGVMDVLRARAEIKSQFRLPMTRIQAAENNPLKHSPNVESALHTLLVQKNPGFLPTVQAFEDAFADIRNHQMAMLEGLRVAFDSMLESFDPKELEKGFERAAKRGFGSAKSKYWDLYADRFSQLGVDADDTFRRLFGDVFAEAYEKQLERLKALGRTGKT